MVTNKKVWVEVSKKAVKENIRAVRSLISPQVKLWAVIKSNAYGHGLLVFSALADALGADGFCVDSVVEGEKLRKAGIRKEILVLGPTVSGEELLRAAEEKISVTISSFEALSMLRRVRKRPNFHIKVDTGMYRQGFYIEDLKKVFAQIAGHRLPVTGIYTHFSSVRGSRDRRFMEAQFSRFLSAIQIAEKSGYPDLIRHAAATAALVTDKKYHLDAVRIGKGLYGLWPSGRKFPMHPALAWRTLIGEVKLIPKGEAVGYGRSEVMKRTTRAALIPIGYWHGFPRALSSRGTVLIRGKRVRAIGKVSMDMALFDISGVQGARVYAPVTLIGRDGREEISAENFGKNIGIGTSEATTRINPLIQRILVY